MCRDEAGRKRLPLSPARPGLGLPVAQTPPQGLSSSSSLAAAGASPGKCPHAPLCAPVPMHPCGHRCHALHRGAAGAPPALGSSPELHRVVMGGQAEGCLRPWAGTRPPAGEVPTFLTRLQVEQWQARGGNAAVLSVRRVCQRMDVPPRAPSTGHPTPSPRTSITLSLWHRFGLQRIHRTRPQLCPLHRQDLALGLWGWTPMGGLGVPMRQPCPMGPAGRGR